MKSENGSQMAMSNNINNHEWCGLLSTYTTQLGQYFNVYGGLDLRYYKGTHKAVLVGLFMEAIIMFDSESRKNVKAENNALAQDANWKNEKLKVGDDRIPELRWFCYVRKEYSDK